MPKPILRRTGDTLNSGSKVIFLLHCFAAADEADDSEAATTMMSQWDVNYGPPRVAVEAETISRTTNLKSKDDLGHRHAAAAAVTVRRRRKSTNPSQIPVLYRSSSATKDLGHKPEASKIASSDQIQNFSIATVRRRKSTMPSQISVLYSSATLQMMQQGEEEEGQQNEPPVMPKVKEAHHHSLLRFPKSTTKVNAEELEEKLEASFAPVPQDDVDDDNITDTDEKNTNELVDNSDKKHTQTFGSVRSQCAGIDDCDCCGGTAAMTTRYMKHTLSCI